MKKNMIKKASCLILVASFATTSYAGAVPSPEFTLLEKVIALQGEGLSQQDAQSQITGALKRYAATAQTDSQQQRMQDALAQLGVYTPAQAKEFMTEAQGAVADLQQSGAKTTGEAQKAIQNAIVQAALNSPKGAQFSFCSDGGSWLTFGGAFAILVGGVVGSSELSDAVTINAPNPPGVSCLLTPNACPGPTNETEVNAVLYGGLVLTAVAFVSFIYASQANCD